MHICMRVYMRLHICACMCLHIRVLIDVVCDIPQVFTLPPHNLHLYSAAPQQSWGPKDIHVVWKHVCKYTCVHVCKIYIYDHIYIRVYVCHGIHEHTHTYSADTHFFNLIWIWEQITLCNSVVWYHLKLLRIGLSWGPEREGWMRVRVHTWESCCAVIV